MLFEPVLAALSSAGVRFVVVGGVAVVLHGCPRLTADLDLAIDLSVGQPERALEALSGLGLVPRLPVDMQDFADPQTRRSWIEERGLTVFSLWDPDNPLLQVDVFAESPLPFDEMWGRAREVRLGGVSIRIASIDDLVTMKLAAGRPQDMADVDALRALAALGGGPG